MVHVRDISATSGWPGRTSVARSRWFSASGGPVCGSTQMAWRGWS